MLSGLYYGNNVSSSHKAYTIGYFLGIMHKKADILIVEDSELVVMVYQRMLDTLKLKADIATHGKEALRLASAGYALILMDLGLPDSDGFSVSTEIRRLEQAQSRKPAYIAGLTSHFLSEVQEKCCTAGMNEVLCKPMAIFQIKSLMRKAGL